MERWLAGGWKGVWSLGEGELGGGVSPMGGIEGHERLKINLCLRMKSGRMKM